MAKRDKTVDAINIVLTEPNYESLSNVLQEAFDRASKGKGKERHAENKPFDKQDIITEGEVFGIDPHLYQIRKKAKECLRMDTDAARRELLDIIVYAAAACIVIDKGGRNE